MKKIILTIILTMICITALQADRIPARVTLGWQSLDKLSEQQKLAECQQLKNLHPDIENEPSVLPSKKKWDMLECEELLKNQPAAQPQTGAEESTKQDMRSYGLAGLLVLLLSATAFMVLWRTKKKNTHAL